AWRKASTNSLKRNFLWPAMVSLAAGVVLFVRGVHHFYAWLSLVMSIFVTITIVREFYKGAKARSVGTGETFIEAVVNLTLRNTRRYGGYNINAAFGLLFFRWGGGGVATGGREERGAGGNIIARGWNRRVGKNRCERNPNATTSRGD